MSKLDLAPTQPLAISPDRVSGALGAAAHGASQPAERLQTRQEVPYYTLIPPKIPCRSCAIMVPYALPIQTGTSWEPCRVVTAYVGVLLDWQPGRVFHERM